MRIRLRPSFPFACHAAPARQQGVATILIILMISLAMTVAAIGVVYNLRGNQEIQVAAHASTQSQASAWAGVEVFRRYLYELSEDTDALAALSGNLDMAINSHAGTLSAEVVSVSVPAGTAATDTFDVTVNIRAQDTAAKSASVLQVMYRVAPYLCNGGAELSSTLDFHRDLSMGGDITILTDSGDTSDFYVDGDVSLDSISATGVDALYATGDIYIGSGAFVPELHSNGNITLVGGAYVGRAFAVGSLTTTGNGRVVDIAYINNDVSLGGGSSGDINTLGAIEVTNWAGYGNLNAANSVTIGGGPIGNIESRGDVSITAYTTVGEIRAEGNVSCPSTGWTAYTSIDAGGTASGCPTSADVRSGSTQAVSTMDEVQPFSMEPVRVDAWMLKSEANYIFEYDGQIKITVSQVAGIPDGSYYLGDHSNGRKDYLCDEVNASGVCTSPAAPTYKICNSYSDYNDCFNYDTASGTWQVGGKNMAPGLVWFEGDLYLGNGQYYNSFIATGNLATANSHKTTAVNFAGYDVICDNQFPVNPSTNFTGLAPTNFCDLANGVMRDNSVGNVALMAGGYNPNHGGNFEGGDISLGASTEIFGTVMAGDYLFTGGDSTIHGYISASGQGASRGGVQNTLGGSTTVDLQSLPSTFDPSLIPNMDSSVGSCGVSDGEVSRAFWTKYL